jgi:predicted 3-demethylubiquinone-9 3-methyltransferase (glyoxalase superfamily)
MSRTQKITTYLWFNGNAEEAVEFYTSVFPDSRVTKVARWGETSPLNSPARRSSR